MDSRFFDQQIFDFCEALQIGYIYGEKMYKDFKKTAVKWTSENWKCFESAKKQAWEYVEFESKQGSWNRFRRAFYCRILDNDRQMYLLGV